MELKISNVDTMCKTHVTKSLKKTMKVMCSINYWEDMKMLDDDCWTWGKRPGTEVWSWVNIWVILDLLSRSMLRLWQLVWPIILLTRFLEVVLAVFSAMVEGWRKEEGGIWERGGMVEWVSSVSFSVVSPCILLNNILPTLFNYLPSPSLIPIMFLYPPHHFCFVYSSTEIDKTKNGVVWVNDWFDLNWSARTFLQQRKKALILYIFTLI